MTDRLLNLFATSEQGTVAGDILAPMLMVVGVVMLALLLTISIRGKIARRQANALSPRERIDALKNDARRREVIETAQVEMLEFARQVSAQLDNKADRLEQLILEAEAAANQLENAIVDRSPRAVPRDEPQAAPQSRAEVNGAPDLMREIYQLADAGNTSLEIARELDEQVGKVELILALRDSA